MKRICLHLLIFPLFCATAASFEGRRSVIAPDKLSVASAPLPPTGTPALLPNPAAALRRLEQSARFSQTPVPSRVADNSSTVLQFQQSQFGFLENRGQIADANGNLRPEIRFLAEANGARLYFRETGISYVFSKTEQVATTTFAEGTGLGKSPETESALPKITTRRMDMDFAGCNPHPRIRAENALEGVSNYYLAHCPQGVLGVKKYAKIVYENIYPNIDLEYLENSGRMKYNFIVHPGGNPAAIRMKYSGAERVTARIDGKLEVQMPDGSIEEQAPLTLQKGREITSSFKVANGEVTFALGEYDRTKDVVIDPWATYFGGSGADVGSSVATDSGGNIYLLCQTSSTDFPTTNSSVFAGGTDCAVVKFNSAGNVLWATYYGGSLYEIGGSIATDANGNPVVICYSESIDLPVTNSSTFGGGTSDDFVVKFNNAGVRAWATYLGGNNYESYFADIATDGNGNIFITGRTQSTNFPVTNFSTLSGIGDAFVVKYSSAGALLWAGYVGGSANETGYGITVDGYNNALVSGVTQSANFPVTNSSVNSGGADAFIMKYANNCSVLWATYYGSPGSDTGFDIATDAAGNVALVGWTNSAVFPVTNSSTLAGSQDTYITKFNSNGLVLWSTYFGGSAADKGCKISIDLFGDIAIAGLTASTNLPVTNSTVYGGGAFDCFAAKFFSAGNGTCQWATYFGGSGDDVINDNAGGIATDISGNIIITGRSQSANLPVTNSSVKNGYEDIFLTQFSFPPTIVLSKPSGGEMLCAGTGVAIMWISTGTTSVNIQISSDGGASFTTVATASSPNGANTYNYFISSGITPGSAYRFRVVSTSDAALLSASKFDISIGNSISIVSQPTSFSQSVCPGSNAGISVVATGLNPSFQWRKDGTALSGQNSSTLTLTNFTPSQAGVYDCVISGACGAPQTSNAVVVSRRGTPVAITEQPKNAALCIGQPATFSVATTGSVVGFQWNKSGIPILGATGKTFAFPAITLADAGTYSCVITDTCGATVSSGTAVLTVFDAAVYLQHPAPVTACEGGAATFSARVQESENPVRFEWAKNGVPLRDDDRITGAGTTTLVINKLQPSDAGDYALMTSQCVTVRSSKTAMLTVNLAPAITAQPRPIVVPVGAKAAFSAVATGAQLTYQWKKNGVAIPGAVVPVFGINSAQKSDVGSYSVAISGACGDVVSAEAELAVSDAPMPVLTLETETVGFGVTRTGGRQQKAVKISNTGSAPLNIASVTIDGDNSAAFTASLQQFTIEPSASRWLSIAFSPVTEGQHAAKLTIAGNADNGEIALSGKGLSNFITPLSAEFGTVELGKSADTLLEIRNLSGEEITLWRATTAGDVASFSFMGSPVSARLPLSLKPDSYLRFPVKFAPVQAGKQRLLIIFSCASGADTMSVEGIGATATGVEDPENSGIVVSPNPASNELNLRLPAGFFNSTVRIVNALGKCCTEQQLYASGSPIDVGNLAAGCYQVFVESNGRQVVLEVMIIH